MIVVKVKFCCSRLPISSTFLEKTFHSLRKTKMNKLLSFQHNENQTPFPKIVANNIHCQSVKNETEPKVHFEEFGE